MAGARFIQFEVVGKDQKALQGFYGELFDWSFDTSNPTAYGMTDPTVTGIIVGIGPSQDGSNGHVTGYVGVPDVDAALARVAELGGKTIVPKSSPAPGVAIALFADPEGHLIGLTEM